ncbi:MAG: pentapeptide repeat-containing protein [Chloroflexi bacterium]|nr:pentapeptide repeat-containing protein [Chloroflexota bacterium]
MTGHDNFQPVRRILASLRDGLGSFVLAAYEERYSGEDYLGQLRDALRRPHSFEDEDQARQDIDLQGWLTAITNKKAWYDVFSQKLGHTAYGAERDSNLANARSYLFVIQNARNSFIAHETARTAVTDDDVYSLADTATRLLSVVKATEQVSETEEIKLEFGRKLYNDEQPSEPPDVGDSEETVACVDLSGLDFPSQDLRGRNLHLANLQGADLSRSNLGGIDLVGMALSSVNLSKCDLAWAHLNGSDLSQADLSEARLECANLRNSNLAHANMARADLREAKIDYSDFSFANLTNADLSNSDERIGQPSIADNMADFDRLFDEVRCGRANFSDAILCRANLRRTFFEPVDFRRADLTSADFTGSRIAAATLTDAILNDANLSQCELLGCDFSGAKMERVNMSGVSYCVHSTFTNADMSGANLEEFFIPEDNIDEEFHWDNVNLSEANLTGAVLPKQSFRNANLSGAVMKEAQLVRTDFSNADLKDTDFTDADLTCADFTSARFYPFSTILPDGTYWDEYTDMTRFTGPLNNC